MTLLRRKTKIIATIGPASDDISVLHDLINAGMNVARLNFSHGNHEEHAQRVANIRQAAKDCKANIAIMLDTRGFEVRTGVIPQELNNGSVDLDFGEQFILYHDYRDGDRHGVGVTYPDLSTVVKIDQPILLDDGAIDLRVVAIEGKDVICKIVAGGRLRSRKGVNIPGVSLQTGAMTEQDKIDIAFGIEHDLDYIAASFVSSANDIIQIREFVESKGANMPIIAKIENRQAVDNLVPIIVEADGAMVARGDLGVEIRVEEVPLMQKKIIRTTVMNGKPVITATQMLDSMERNPRPTRAEATDVANAIFDGTSAVMLSGETAAGNFPVEAIETMSKLAVEAEAALHDYGTLQKINTHPSYRETEAVSQAAITMAHHLDASAIITLTQSGFTSRNISKFRPRSPILAVTRNPDVVRKLAMNWGVTAIYCSAEDDNDLVNTAIAQACEGGFLRVGDRVVVTAGITNQPGSTSTIRVETIR